MVISGRGAMEGEGPGPSHVEDAHRRIRSRVRKTPLLRSHELSEEVGRPVWIKYENLQETGSFKLRGAANFLLRIAERRSDGDLGVVACSSGNHGRAVAWVAGSLGIPATLCVPEWVDRVKLRAMEEAGASVLRVGDRYEDAEAEALRLAEAEGLQFVPPFDDPWIVAGQGTLAREIQSDLAALLEEGVPGDLMVPLSGGGLAAGCLSALRGSSLRTVGVGASRAPVMLRSLEAGRPLSGVEERKTLASALSGGIGVPNRWTFPLLHAGFRQGAFRTMEVEEASIARSVRFCFRRLRTLVEGGGAVALAAIFGGTEDSPVLPDRIRDRSGPLIIVLSGGNLDPVALEKVLDPVSSSAS